MTLKDLIDKLLGRQPSSASTAKQRLQLSGKCFHVPVRLDAKLWEVILTQRGKLPIR